MPDELPIRDVVERILQAEGESKSILEEALVEANLLAADAQRQAQEMTHSARREAAKEAELIIRVAEQEAALEKQDRLAQAAADIELAACLEEQAVRSASDAVLRCVCGGKTPI